MLYLLIIVRNGSLVRVISLQIIYIHVCITHTGPKSTENQSIIPPGIYVYNIIITKTVNSL